MALDIQLLRTSFNLLAPKATELISTFYEILWRDYPTSKTLFETVNMEVQKKALLHSIVHIVENVDKSEKLVPYLEAMGARHTRYGTQSEHYEWVGQSLIKAMKTLAGPVWTPAIEACWCEAFGVISSTMRSGAAKQLRANDA